MRRMCHCGGMFVRTDIYLDLSASLKYGRPMFSQRSTDVATWKCNSCGATRSQRLRQPRSKGSHGEQEFDGSGIS